MTAPEVSDARGTTPRSARWYACEVSGSLKRRPSKSADEARKREIERVLAMTPRERALLALRLGRRMRAIAEGRTNDEPR